MSVVHQSLTRHEKNYNIRFVLHRNPALYWGNMDQNQIYIDQILFYAINAKVLTKFGKYYHKKTTKNSTRLSIYMPKYIRPQFKHIF
jgi:hypothetical protein